jgi:hypothetical protein
MAENDSSRGGGFPINITGLLTLLALAGSLLLVSRQLTSDRPRVPAGKPASTIGDQKIDARLWEDPLSIRKKKPDEEGMTLAPLLTRLRAHTNETTLLLPVMLDGAIYSEDQEARLRTRFAVVSALGQAGFAPEDPEHLGAAGCPWPSSMELELIQKNQNGFDGWPVEFSSSLQVSFEWYFRREFYPREATNATPEKVLVLWLNEDSFADNPLLRLAYLLRPLLNAATNTPLDVSVIGPWGSSTLRAMLPGEFSGERLSATLSPGVWRDMTNVLQRVNLFSPTATAMDEVLVRGARSATPRAAVAQRLTNGLFKSFHNFGATDDQLAGEILEELALRGVDLCQTNLSPNANHLVLISEWDTFYGRMLSLTYAAELACRQNPKAFPSRAEFVEAFQRGTARLPANLHTFVFLSGLDGQTAANGSEAYASGTNPSGSDDVRESGAENLKRWTPDANKAIGQAQYDYLSRLGNSIEKLDAGLRREQQGTVAAIGIVGGDLYDTLLILQALRPRFPNAIFFTTDLDARLWDPAEWEWSRNLVVVCGYGLQLHPDLQGEVSPFRGSYQTAQFAAVLAAVDTAKQPQLLALSNIPPRRFEIGRFGPVDLSVKDGGRLHPLPPGQRGRDLFQWKLLTSGLIGLSALIVLATLISRPFIRLTRERRYFLADSLWLREEDIGGLEGFRVLRRQSGEQSDPVAQWMARVLASEPARGFSTELWVVAPSSAGISGVDAGMKTMLEDRARMQWFLDKKVNQCLCFAWAGETGARIGPFISGRSLATLKKNRQDVGEVLDRLLRRAEAGGDEQLARLISSRADAAASAREAGSQKFLLRRARQRGFWASVVLFSALALWLGHAAWHDTTGTVLGEPASLISGASAWPTEWLRLLAIALTVGFIVESYTVLRTTVLDLTREFRLKISQQPGRWKWWLSSTPVPQAVAEADDLWQEYQQKGRWTRRCARIVLPLLAYFVFAWCLASLGTIPKAPLRGEEIFRVDKWMLLVAVLGFLFLTFWTMDAARLCRWFIEHLSEAPSHYPKATREHFSALRGGMPGHLLNEWLDLQLIAELTGRVGRMIYLPFIVFFVLLVSRNSWWDFWPWSAGLVMIFVLNLSLAVGGLLILRRSARRAWQFALASLQSKLDQLRGAQAVTESEKSRATLDQMEKLLDEIRGLNTGAFASFWESPILGALLVPSGGTALIELTRYLVGH